MNGITGGQQMLQMQMFINCHTAVKLSRLRCCLVYFLFYFENSNYPLVSGHLPFLMCPWSDVTLIPDCFHLFPITLLCI